MSVLVFAETENGQIKKSTFEVVTYAAMVAKQLGTQATALVLGTVSNASGLGKSGASSILHDSNASFDKVNIAAYKAAVVQAANQVGASVVILPKSTLADSLAAGIAAQLKASVATNVTELPDTSAGFKVRRSIYTGKAFAWVNLTGTYKLLTVKKNAVAADNSGAEVAPQLFSVNLSSVDGKVSHLESVKAGGEISLTEAEIVISGGRGLKGPENWHLVTKLAEKLKAGTACSKPVSDLDWRPHHEHVGQTGVKISPNLYIAIGISGAIQHVAGISSSKVIVAINSDPEAPIFKAADYGIVGNAFEIVPKLIDSVDAAL